MAGGYSFVRVIGRAEVMERDDPWRWGALTAAIRRPVAASLGAMRAIEEEGLFQRSLDNGANTSRRAFAADRLHAPRRSACWDIRGLGGDGLQSNFCDRL